MTLLEYPGDPKTSQELRQLLLRSFEYLRDERFAALDFVTQQSISILNRLRFDAVLLGNEAAANTAFVAMAYPSFFQAFKRYWMLIRSGSYRKAWDSLQDAIDHIRFMLRHTSDAHLYYLPYILRLLQAHEELYPFKVFASSEFRHKRSNCSLCQRSCYDLACPHIPGRIYWGNLARRIVVESEVLAVAMVKNPMDKRCVMEISGDTRPDFLKYPIVHAFNQRARHPLGSFIGQASTKRVSGGLVVTGYFKFAEPFCPSTFLDRADPISQLAQRRRRLSFSIAL